MFRLNSMHIAESNWKPVFPEDNLFGKADEQADKRLINDLKEVRKQLRETNNLKLELPTR